MFKYISDSTSNLLQGQMYLSHNWICFYSKIKARGRLIEIPMDKIISITREKLALFIPNAIGIQIASKKYVFGSFIARDSTYKKLVAMWKLNQDSTSGAACYPTSQPDLTSDTSETSSSSSSYSDTTSDLMGHHSGTQVIHPRFHSDTHNIANEARPHNMTRCLRCTSLSQTVRKLSQKLQEVPKSNLIYQLYDKLSIRKSKNLYRKSLILLSGETLLAI